MRDGYLFFMRNISLPILLLVAAACSAPPPPPAMLTIAPTTDSLVVPAVGITAAAPQSDGTWTLLALIEDQLYHADFVAKTVTPFPGITKTEVPHPLTLIPVGDSVIVGDWGLRRATEWSPAGQRLNAWPAPDALHGALPRARDAAGQWYFQISPDPKEDGSGLLDSAAVVRGDAQLSRFDTLARLAVPEVGKVAGVSGTRYQRKTMGGDDAWGVLPDGTLWIARVFQNYVELRHPGATKVVKWPRLRYVVYPINDMDREIYARRFPEEQRQAARELPNVATKPPFEHVFAVAGGRMWLSTSDTSLAPVRHFQVIDSTGVLFNVAVPSRGYALGVTDSYILMAEEFPGGIRLLRYPVPGETKK
jgi:hypothetical protein